MRSTARPGNTARPGLYDQDGGREFLEPAAAGASSDRYGPIIGAQLLRKAEVFAEAAEMALDEDHQVAAVLAALAGVTASDALCSLRLGRRSSPMGHRDAPRLLTRAEPGAQEVVATLEALIRMREGAMRPALTRGEASRAVSQAAQIIDFAEQLAFGRTD